MRNKDKKRKDVLGILNEDMSRPDEIDAGGNGKLSVAEMEKIREEIYPEVEAEVRERLEDEYSKKNQALLVLINHLFQTEDKYLPELTNIPWTAILPLSIMMMKEHVLDEERIKAEVPLSAIWRIFWMKLRRSGEGEQFTMGVRLAEQQIAATSGQEEMMPGLKAT